MSETSDFIRKTFQAGDDLRDAGLTTPEGIVRYDDILYGEDPAWQVLDVYRPKNQDGQTLPVIVSVHGGGWVYGDKERYQYYGMNLAEHGFAVVNFTYRLAPEFQFPSSLEDTNLVFAWVLNHADEYGFDKSHVFAVGDSAGAHILGLYSAFCTNPEYAKEYSFQPPEGFIPTAVALNCGVYEIRKLISGDGKMDRGLQNQNLHLMEDLLPGKGTEEELEKISVVSHVTDQYPPVFLMTAAGDFAKEQAPVMAEVLVKYEIPFILRFFGSPKDKPAHVFHCNIKLPIAKLCNDDECEFFRSWLPLES